MRGLGLSCVLVAGAASMLAGCGDPALCDANPLVVLQIGDIAVDTGPLPGVQTDVHVRTSLAEGSSVTLEVFDGASALLAQSVSLVTPNGDAVFDSITVPRPWVRLRATGQDQCGASTDELVVHVTAPDQGPVVGVAIISPEVPCGSVITPGQDAESATEGVQIVVHVDSPTALTKSIELVNSDGTMDFDATTDVALTLAPGNNSFIGIALDAHGNQAQSASCGVTFTPLSVSFALPAASGEIIRADGVVSGDAITFPLCGTVDHDGADVELSIDGGTAVPATVTGTTWCRTVTLTESSHTLLATASLGPLTGSASLALGVDLTLPPALADFTAAVVDRRHIHLAWTSPSDAGQAVATYIVKSATSPITEASFDAIGGVLATGTPAPPGTPEQLDLIPTEAGVTSWFAAASTDAAGNRSPAVIVGPVTPAFTRSGAIVPPDPSQGALALGTAIVHGRFNDDNFDDVAVSAPGQSDGASPRAGAVYIYFGSAGGLSATPDVILTGATMNGRFGAGLAVVSWSGADDLAVGAPGEDHLSGRIYVFDHASLTPGTHAVGEASLHIGASTTASWFTHAGLGSTLAAADIDGDGRRDLVIGAPKGGGTGGIAIVYAGMISGDVALSDSDASGASNALVDLFEDPGTTPGRQLGYYLHAVGPLDGPGDLTDELVAGYIDDRTTTGDSVYVLRGDGTRPATPGVRLRPFTVGRDVRIDYVTVHSTAAWGSQATSIEDQDGDGVRDLVISAFASGTGEVLIVSGATLGAGGIATTADPGVVLSRITAGPGVSRVGAVIAEHDHTGTDIDRDGHDDLIIGGTVGAAAHAFVWYGGAIPSGAATTQSAIYVFAAPATFAYNNISGPAPAGAALWVGDVDADSLDDVCWSSPTGNAGDGSFELLR